MFKQRSYKKELLDEPFIEKELLFQNLKELEIINKHLGGHAVSLKGLRKIFTDKVKQYTMIDIGCGGGDSMKAISKWATQNQINIEITGLDLKQDCIDFAKENCQGFSNLKFSCDDFRNAFSGENKIDMVHASLFCHHFTENELVEFVKLCSKNKSIFLINDLERNPIAYFSIKWITGLFSKSILVKNDAPLSVLRGFKKPEWRSILKKAGINHFEIKNRWAFRHLLLIYPNE